MNKDKINKDYKVTKTISSVTMLISLVVAMLSASMISGADTLVTSGFVFLYGSLIVICLGFLGYVLWEIEEDVRFSKIKKRLVKTKKSENILYNIIIALLSLELTFVVIKLLNVVIG